jgi:hypothetical protein
MMKEQPAPQFRAGFFMADARTIGWIIVIASDRRRGDPKDEPQRFRPVRRSFATIAAIK